MRSTAEVGPPTQQGLHLVLTLASCLSSQSTLPPWQALVCVAGEEEVALGGLLRYDGRCGLRGTAEELHRSSVVGR